MMTDQEKSEKMQMIINLEAELSSGASEIGDWKIAKCYEYSLTGKEMPYDIEELSRKRQQVRDEINKLREEVAVM